MTTTETTSAATVAMLAQAFRPSHPLSPFPANQPQSDADWRLYHIADWAGVIEQNGLVWNRVEVVGCDTCSSNYNRHSYLIRVPWADGRGADWAVLYREDAPGFECGAPAIYTETDDPDAVTLQIDWSDAWDRYSADQAEWST